MAGISLVDTVNVFISSCKLANEYSIRPGKVDKTSPPHFIHNGGLNKQRRRRRLAIRRLKNELVFLLQISRMAECIQPA